MIPRSSSPRSGFILTRRFWRLLRRYSTLFSVPWVRPGEVEWFITAQTGMEHCFAAGTSHVRGKTGQEGKRSVMLSPSVQPNISPQHTTFENVCLVVQFDLKTALDFKVTNEDDTISFITILCNEFG